MADKILINSGATVSINTVCGCLTIYGNNAVTKVTTEQLSALKKRKDFNTWVEKGYIILNAPLYKVDDAIAAKDEADIKAQQKEAVTVKLEALTESIMKNEGITNKKEALKEARKRLNMEADKATQAGDSDAQELKATANAEIK